MDGIEETFFSQNLNDTKLFAKKIAKNLKPGDIVAFIGYLATGKTTLIKEIAQALKTKEAVSSPTFSYLNIYNAKYTIYHFDLYRLKNYDHFQSLGFKDFFYKGGICLIEWADIIAPYLPKNTIYLYLHHENYGKRKFSLKKAAL